MANRHFLLHSCITLTWSLDQIWSRSQELEPDVQTAIDLNMASYRTDNIISLMLSMQDDWPFDKFGKEECEKRIVIDLAKVMPTREHRLSRLL